MTPPISTRLARACRTALIPVALCLAATGAQAQLVGNLLTTVVGTVDSLVDLLADTAPANYGKHRDARVVAANSSTCRVQERLNGAQRVSYGTGSPRARQLLNDCTLLGAPTAPAAP